MNLFLATERIPYEGEMVKGLFTTLEAAKKAAVYAKRADFHIGKVYELSANQTLVDATDREEAVVWREDA